MTLAAVGNVAGQTYPTKPIRIVTGGPGGGADFASRVMAAMSVASDDEAAALGIAWVQLGRFDHSAAAALCADLEISGLESGVQCVA